jgi:Gluconate 2-dehydrogenase subunit 3
MNRREALSSVALLLGGTIIGAEMFLSGCKNPASTVGAGGLSFSPDDISFLDEVGEVILPATNTPGAKGVQIGQFMKTIVTDCYEPVDQQIFISGMKKLDEESIQKCGKPFLDTMQEQRHNLLAALDLETRAYQKQIDDYFASLTLDKQGVGNTQQSADEKNPKKEKMRKYPKNYFIMMKQLTLWGYFTSKEGATMALRYVAVPGHYDGCIDYKKGDKAWATS